jgi:hypothetical protein
METHHLAAHNEMNFNSLITDDETGIDKEVSSRLTFNYKHFHTNVLMTH